MCSTAEWKIGGIPICLYDKSNYLFQYICIAFISPDFSLCICRIILKQSGELFGKWKKTETIYYIIEIILVLVTTS